MANLFEHRHFSAMASIIADLPEAMRDDVANHFAFALRSSNPRFDYDRFEAAARGQPATGRDTVTGPPSRHRRRR